jgi:hypothetical protein
MEGKKKERAEWGEEEEERKKWSILSPWPNRARTLSVTFASMNLKAKKENNMQEGRHEKWERGVRMEEGRRQTDRQAERTRQREKH